MKIVILVPSGEYRASAGARIRYGRLAEAMSRAGHSLELVTVADFAPDTVDCDALVISKCHDARALIAAGALRHRGKLVGVDLFDDYFSQVGDSRLVGYRYWLSELLGLCNFCLCSTPALAEVANRYQPLVPTHLINDPSPRHVPADAAAAADSKTRDARERRVVDVAWFGVGDNPHFEVGLNDLFGQSAMLSRLQRSGYRVELTIVTNRRALSADGLEMINRLPVAHRIQEWSEAAEAEVLHRSLVAFLPVAHQRFSIAKSLNRAVTALSHGCQVLSSGAAIYSVLDPLIYRDPARVVADLVIGDMRLSSSSLPLYLEKLAVWADAGNESAKLVQFLGSLTKPPLPSQKRIAIVHGFATRGEVEQLVHKVGGLSIRSPFTAARLQYDTQFVNLPPNMVTVSSEPPKVESVTFAYQIISYPAALAEIRQRLAKTYGSLRLFVSDTSRVPVSVAAS